MYTYIPQSSSNRKRKSKLYNIEGKCFTVRLKSDEYKVIRLLDEIK